MWRTLASMLAVFAVWGAVLAGLVALGAPASAAELACAGGAGVMLVGLGLRMNRRLPRALEATTPAAPVQRRASV